MGTADPRESKITNEGSTRTLLVRYGAAVLIVALVAAVRLGLEAWIGFHQRYLLFFPAIVLVAMFAGLGPGVVAAVFSATCAELFALRQEGAFLTYKTADLVALTTYLGSGVFFSLLAENRSKVKRALEESERRFKAVYERAPVGIALVDSASGQFRAVNPSFCKMLGRTEQEVLQLNFQSVTHPDDLVESLLKVKRLVEGTCPEFELEKRYVLANGQIVWASVSVAPMCEGLNAQKTFLVMAREITRRKQAEEALRRREEDYRRFVAQTSEGIFRQELDTPVPIDLPEDELVHSILRSSYIAECNDALARMYGLSVQAFVGRRLSETPSDPQNLELTREFVRSGFRVLDRELHERDSKGQPKVFRCSLIGIVESGKLFCTWGIQRDVTEKARLEQARTEAEKSLQKSEAHFRILVEQASDGIFIADEQGRYVDVNSAGAEMLGYTRDEVLQLSVADVVAAEELPRIKLELDRVVEGATVRSEWRFQRKDGSFFPGEVGGRRLPDGRLQGILRDMTERRNAEDALRRSAERFRVALKDSPVTVFNQDRDLRYTWIYNPDLYWQQEIIGKTDVEVLGADFGETLNKIKRQVLETGKGLREEVVIPHDHMSYSFDLSIEPLHDAQGNIVGITGASVDIARLRELVDGLQEAKEKLVEQNQYLEHEIESQFGFEQIIGQSAALKEVLKKARVVAPTDSSVLLLGETGTGKEIVARSIHGLSTRRDKAFIKLNCAAVPSGLLESELFGHEKGAFTGAVSQKAGRLELADKGTLFLDEIGELPLELQPKLLRVLQDHEFERLGSVRTLHVDVRVISATNRNLERDIAKKKFRDDLFYRLNVFPIPLPPLRERRSDIPRLVQHFVRKHAARMGRQIDIIPAETMSVLQNWNWPGNVRELENMIERMVIMTKDRALAPPPAELDIPSDAPEDNLLEIEREHILRILRETNGVLSGADGAASRLGLKRTTLQSMLKRMNVDLRHFRRDYGNFGTS